MKNIKIKDPKVKKNIIIITFIVLIILIIKQYKENRRLKNIIVSSEEYIIGTTTVSLPRNWIIPILSEKPINLKDIYRLDGMLRISNSLFQRNFETTELEKSQYLEKTRIGVQRLIKLIESNGNDEEIDKLVDELIEIQNKILENSLDTVK